MITTEQKTAYEKRIEYLERKEQKTKEMMEELLLRIKDIETDIRCQSSLKEFSVVNLADHSYQSSL
jgi:hypothetical protein